MSELSVGIDLGTTNSCVAFSRNGNLEVVNIQGKNTTPSQVTFSDTMLVGEAAKMAAEEGEDLDNTVFNAKRLIGRSYSEWQKVSAEMSRNWPFKIVDRNGKPHYQVKFKGATHYYSPEKISSFVLKMLKDSTEEFLGRPVSKAVISVPAYFNSSQREATEKAAQMAGFEVLQLCSEPVMAGIAHDPKQKVYHEKRIIVFDCGGGTTDIAIIHITSDGQYDVVATSGDMNLGGETIVDMMIDFFMAKISQETDQNFKNDKQATIRLRSSCDRAKQLLSGAPTATVLFEYKGYSLKWKMSVTEFEKLCSSAFDKMVATIDDALSAARLDEDDISEVLLAGGTSRIPAIQKRLASRFGIEKIRKTLNPDQAIAQGAAIMAANLLERAESATTGLLVYRFVQEILPLSLNIETSFQNMNVMVKRGEKLPLVREATFITANDNQTSMVITVIEGERALSSDNTDGFLGNAVVEGLPSKRRGQVKVVVKFELSASGVLKVTAMEPTTGRTANLDVENRQRDAEDIRLQLRAAEQNARVDENHRAVSRALVTLQDRLHEVKHAEEDKGSTKKASIIALCDELNEWIKGFNTGSGPRPTLSEIDRRSKSFEASVKSMLDKPAYFLPDS